MARIDLLQLSVPVLLALPALAQTFVVDRNNGPGTNYTAIEAAFAAVPNGATVLVRPGAYTPLGDPAIVGKSVTVLCEPGVELLLAPGRVVAVNGLGATQQVVLRGMGLRSTHAVGIGTLRCIGNQGRILVDDVSGGAGQASLVAVNCDWLAVSGSSFVAGVECTDSRSVFEDCLLSNTADSTLVLVRGDAQLTDTQVYGAIGFGGLPAGGAVELVQADLRVLGDSSIEGRPVLGTNLIGVAFVGSGTLRLDPAVNVVGALPLIPATIAASTVAMPHVTTVGGALGSNATAALHGPIGHLGILGVGLPGPVVPVPGSPDPAFWLPTPTFVQAIGSPAIGQPLTAVTAIPNSTTLRGTALIWHGFTYDPSVGLQTSNPSFLVLE